MNDTYDRLDHKQELEISIEKECCMICGKPLMPRNMVYKQRDDTYVHEQCKLDEISGECIEWGEVLTAERERKKI